LLCFSPQGKSKHKFLQSFSSTVIYDVSFRDHLHFPLAVPVLWRSALAFTSLDENIIGDNGLRGTLGLKVQLWNEAEERRRHVSTPSTAAIHNDTT